MKGSDKFYRSSICPPTYEPCYELMHNPEQSVVDLYTVGRLYHKPPFCAGNVLHRDWWYRALLLVLCCCLKILADGRPSAHTNNKTRGAAINTCSLHFSVCLQSVKEKQQPSEEVETWTHHTQDSALTIVGSREPSPHSSGHNSPPLLFSSTTAPQTDNNSTEYRFPAPFTRKLFPIFRPFHSKSNIIKSTVEEFSFL